MIFDVKGLGLIVMDRINNNWIRERCDRKNQIITTGLGSYKIDGEAHRKDTHIRGGYKPDQRVTHKEGEQKDLKKLEQRDLSFKEWN